MRLSAKTNVDEVVRALESWGEAVLNNAVPRALNKIIKQVETRAIQQISREYTISPGQMRKYLTLTLSSGPNVPASLVAKGRGFPLVLFNPRQEKRKGGGVYVKMKGRTVKIPHAFLLRIGGGDRQVFARGSYSASPGGLFNPTGERIGRFRFGRGRFPISLLRTFGPPEALRNRAVVEAIIERAKEQAAKVLAQEIRFESIRRRG